MKKKPVKEKLTEKQAAYFKVLGDPTRLKLVVQLCHQHDPDCLCVNALAGVLGVSQSAVSQHLRILREAGLVKAERRGYHVHYAIDHQTLEEIHELYFDALLKNNPD